VAYEEKTMLRALATTLIVSGALTSTAVQAQYYDSPGYYDPPPRYYRNRDYYQRYYEGPPEAITRLRRGDPGYEPWRPRYDPRNGGTYCVQQGYTVQNGVCKPYRGY
jgi:hypothetical protein